MNGDFEGRQVAVTGAGGDLGGAVTRELVRRGAVVHLPGRSAIPPGRFADLPAERVRAQAGVDLADEVAVRRFYGGVRDLWASVHVAGGFDMASIVETSLDELAHLWRINTVTCFLCCREAVRALRAGGGGGGRIVNVAARPALEPRTGSGMTAYTMSKAAVAALTRALAEEVAGEGIWVNAVAPSILDTPANRAAMPGADPSGWAKVEEVAATIAFLASPRNSAARGGVIPVYGRS